MLIFHSMSMLILASKVYPGYTTEFKCNQNDETPQIHFSPAGALIQVNTSVYVVNQETKVFVVNCTSNKPVSWRYKGSIANTIARDARTISYKRYENKIGFIEPCYYSALIFPSVEDEITGKYSCTVNAFEAFQVGSGASNGFVLFSGLSLMTLRDQTLTYDLNWITLIAKQQRYIQKKYPYKLPCARNHPETTLSIFYTQFDKGSKWIEESHFTEVMAVAVYVYISKDELPRQYKCEARNVNNSNLPPEMLHINIPHYPVSLYWPLVTNIVYKIPSKFYCFSRIPVRIIKEDELSTQLWPATNDAIDIYKVMGFEYAAAVDVQEEYLEPSSNANVGQVSCKDIGTNGTLVNWTWNYKITPGMRTIKTSERRVGLKGIQGRASCITAVSPENARIRYFEAATDGEAILRQQCLTILSEEWNICNHPKPDLETQANPDDKVVVFANLPKGISGLFRCVTPDITTVGKFNQEFAPVVDGGLGDATGDVSAFIKFSTSSNETIALGDTVNSTCTTATMFIYGPGNWILSWKNLTQSSVPPAWIQADNIENIGAFYVRKSAITVESLDIVGITCGGVSSKHFLENGNFLSFPKPPYTALIVKEKNSLQALSPLEITVTVLSVTVAVVAISISLVVFWVRRQKFKANNGVYEKIVQSFFNGNEEIAMGETNMCETVESKPYDRSFEISNDYLIIDWSSPLGCGAFGLVLCGTCRKEIKEQKAKVEMQVAIKTLKEGADSMQLKALMSELKVMIYIGNHVNLVSLIGAVTEQLSKKKLFVILEFCEKGSLQRYLQNHRSAFSANYNIDRQTGIQRKTIYMNAKFNESEMKPENLLTWGREIVSGMEYLFRKKIMHGDLATRNILLDANLTAKISDFGLSRRLYEQYEYVKKSEEPLPWRWMAIESLRDMTFSSETDVWSFGVTLWEIYSLAETPYAGIIYSPEFIQNLEKGLRLSTPPHSPTHMYDLMIRCWHKNAKQRPTFHELAESLDAIMGFDVSNDKDLTSVHDTNFGTDFVNTTKDEMNV